MAPLMSRKARFKFILRRVTEITGELVDGEFIIVAPLVSRNARFKFILRRVTEITGELVDGEFSISRAI